ncbi:hypothetical protein M3Y97_00207600 [Aphelenchoides bicaudatus]|nr:hypothetical protein M3Y97_00207600 [Aphelenchoides bicaudatus]
MLWLCCFFFGDMLIACISKMSEKRESSSEDVNLINEDDQNSIESETNESSQPFHSVLADALNNEEPLDADPNIDLSEIPPVKSLFDPPPNTSDPLHQFKPQNWRGLFSAIRNEPIDPIQLGKDIFDETQGSGAKYRCILNGLSGRPLQLDIQSLYNRRMQLVKRLGSDNDTLVQLYDFNMGCLAKMDLDRRAFNKIAAVINQNIFHKLINSDEIPNEYKFNPNQMHEIIFFTPVDLDEYKSTNSAEVLNNVVELNLSNQTEIARQIALETYNLCVKPEFLGRMSITSSKNKRAFMSEFFTFLKRTLYQAFGIRYQKFINLNLETLSSGLPTSDHPNERAAAVILIRIAMDTLQAVCCEKESDSSDQSDDESSSKNGSSTKKGNHGRKRRMVSE